MLEFLQDPEYKNASGLMGLLWYTKASHSCLAPTSQRSEVIDVEAFSVSKGGSWGLHGFNGAWGLLYFT